MGLVLVIEVGHIYLFQVEVNEHGDAADEGDGGQKGRDEEGEEKNGYH